MKVIPEINNKYLRNNIDYSLALKGMEDNLETGKCNYFTDRKDGTSAKYIVQTYSVGGLKSVEEKMILPENGDITQLRGSGVSVHYVIDKDGTIYQLVPDNKRPWAAGAGDLITGSKLNPDISPMKNSMNDWCIDIMSINNGKEPLTDAQLESNIALTSHLVEKHNIDSTKVIALGDWAPGRHIAPGPYFPWQEFASKGLGLWSHVTHVKDPEVIVSWKGKNSPEETENLASDFQELRKNLEQKFGMVGFTNQNDSDQENSDLLSSAVNFNLHHLGREILENEGFNAAYQALWHNSSNTDARVLLGEWNTNSQNILDSFLDGNN